MAKALRIARIQSTRTLGSLTEQQRVRLARLVYQRDGGYETRGTPSDAQHMRALANANRNRLALAALKREIAAGETSVADVLREPSSVAAAAAIGDLLAAQSRWGPKSVRRFLAEVPMLESKTLGSMTDRQRLDLAGRLDALTLIGDESC